MATCIYENVTVLNHPLIKHNLSVLRDKNTNCEVFNMALKRIAYALFYEATKNLPTETINLETPVTDRKSVV